MKDYTRALPIELLSLTTQVGFEPTTSELMVRSNSHLRHLLLTLFFFKG